MTENLKPFGGWDNEDDLEFNTLIDSVSMGKAGYVSDARLLKSIAPSGNVSITVLIKQKIYSKAIECVDINAEFKTVSIVSVVKDIYKSNLTTQNEAAHIIDNVVENIIHGSGILDIAINVGNDTGNISWVVLEGEDIATELATISSITSNEDIVDAQTTTTYR